MNVQRYLVVYERTVTGYSAYAPDVPGCVAAAETMEDTGRLMNEALAFHLEALDADGTPVPQPSARADFVEVRLGA